MESTLRVRSRVNRVGPVLGWLLLCGVLMPGASPGLEAAQPQGETPARGAASAAGDNLLRNGSFEGGLLYWHNVRPEQHALVREGKVGQWALRIEKGYVTSAPMVTRRGERYTISFFARADRPAGVRVSMHPSAREDGQRAKRLWSREGSQSAEVGTEWSRVSFTFEADVPPSAFWPLPHYMVQIGDAGAPITIDGAVVQPGAQAAEGYVPRRPIEVVAECPDLPGYEGAKANLLTPGAEVRMIAHVSNPGPETREVTVRWQLYDYEGVRPIGKPVERRVLLDAGQTRSETAVLRLSATGTLIARITALDPSGPQGEAAVLDSSDFPLSSLPYPKSATRPDPRERFGGSFAGGIGCVEKFQRIGFGWIRWRPHANGRDHLPEAPRPGEAWKWHWFDQELDEQEARGCSAHICLYPPPDWIMEKGHPLPKDMRWQADDPRWQDLSVQTVWDRFVAEAVRHYRGRSVIYEIENEPEFDHWDTQDLLDEYAQFTMRTARCIKQADPQARVMVNNVYGIPSRVNAALFRAGGLKHIDVISWHDYHAGWLADHVALRRMRQNIDEAGGEHVEIWFNEGWAFTNTLVDEPIACTSLNCVESTHAIVNSTVELTTSGQEKTILFHTAYETHGMSFWDYSGPGTMLWGWYNYPLPLVPAWNVLCHHIGISDEVGMVRPPHANFCIFQDLRNGRGVMFAYADRDAKEDVTVELPDFGAPLMAEDIMGNAAPAPSTLVLSKTGRPVILYTTADTPGQVFYEKLEPLDRKHAGFVTRAQPASEGEPRIDYRLPPVWEGTREDSSDGNPATAEGQPIWRLDQLWPPEPERPANYRALVWKNGWWRPVAHSFGDQPKAELKDGALRMEFRAPHGQPRAARLCALSFIAPKAGRYRVAGQAAMRLWDGSNPVRLTVLKKSKDRVESLASVPLKRNESVPLAGIEAELQAGEELVLLPRIEGLFTGGDVTLRELVVSIGGAEPPRGTIYRLPAAWEGKEKGSTAGNPISAEGKPIWRIDRLWPDQPIYAENYHVVPWDGTAWHPEEHQQGGQPSVRVENGGARIAVAGPWQGHEFQKIAGLVFIAPADGVYRIRAKASTKPWSGQAETFRLAILKKDTQRAAEVAGYELPRAGTVVAIDARVELTVGHELVLLPLVPHWNNATAVFISELEIEHRPAADR